MVKDFLVIILENLKNLEMLVRIMRRKSLKNNRGLVFVPVRYE